MRDVIASIEAEYQRYRALGEGVMGQLTDDDLSATAGEGGNSVATLVAHLSGNFRSRFTDFLASDGEKPWRRREEEFVARAVTRAQVNDAWERGWQVLMATLGTLSDDDLARSVMIRGQSLRVSEALHRSLAHAAYHVGQMVLIGRLRRGPGWSWLSIPPGGTDAYNRNPVHEKPGPPAGPRGGA